MLQSQSREFIFYNKTFFLLVSIYVELFSFRIPNTFIMLFFLPLRFVHDDTLKSPEHYGSNNDPFKKNNTIGNFFNRQFTSNENNQNILSDDSPNNFYQNVRNNHYNPKDDYSNNNH